VSTTLVDYQHQLGGYLIGRNTPVTIETIEGLGRAEVRTSDVDPPLADGTWPGVDYYTGRTVRIAAAVKTPGDPAGALDIIAGLQAAADSASIRLSAGATMLLRLKFPGRPVRVLRGRLRKADADLAAVIHGWAPLDLEFLATDPRFYADDDSEQPAIIPLGLVSGGGFRAPVRAPVYVTPAISTLPSARPGWIVNAGTTDTWPVLRITGPCSNPSVLHVASGRTLAFPDLVLGIGQWVEIDTRPPWRSVIRETGGSADSVLSRTSRPDLFSLPKGASEIRWTATDPTNTSRLSVSWQSAWLAL
jgi:hypothetical protein